MKQTIYAGNIAGLTHSKPDFGTLAVGELLILMPEPINEFDPRAVRIETLDGVKLGYIPKESTVVFHDAIANRLTPTCEIVEINTAGRFPKVIVHISVTLS